MNLTKLQHLRVIWWAAFNTPKYDQYRRYIDSGMNCRAAYRYVK